MPSPVTSGVATRKTAQKTAQDCGSRAARTGRRARVRHDFGQRFDGRVGMCSCERFNVCEVFWHFPLVALAVASIAEVRLQPILCKPKSASIVKRSFSETSQGSRSINPA
jgi:hypothetical protein